MSILTGDEGSEEIAVDQQSSAEVQNQESGKPAQDVLQDEEQPPSSEETCQQRPSYQSAEEEPETPASDECDDSGHPQITIDLTALTSHLSGEEECRSGSPPTVTDVSTHHLRQTLENPDPTGGGEAEFDECTEGVETVETKCILTEENINNVISTAAAASSAGEQEDIQSNHGETKLSDETDVCVTQDIG